MERKYSFLIIGFILSILTFATIFTLHFLSGGPTPDLIPKEYI
jgi:hypothetical protein